MTPETSRPFDKIWAAPTPDISLLKAYTRAKQSIARSIRSIQSRLAQLKKEDLSRQYQELMVKLAEDRFTLAVVGQFKRGKSSLMNAVIGRDLLPTGVLPLTSAITVLRFGPAERLVVFRENSIFSDELPLGRLAEFVTERGNPGNVKQVKTARVEVPLAFLRPGLEFVDTPGVGSALEANTATTSQFLPQCDAVLFVTSVESPLSKSEWDFLKSVRLEIGKVFFVVNKIDLLNPEESADVLQYVRESLAQFHQDQRISLYPVSARQGLQAKQTGNVELYCDSGLQSLEESLAAFLSTEKATTFLDSILDKAIHFLPDELSVSDTAAATDGFWENMRQRLLAMRSRLCNLLQEPEPALESDDGPENTSPDDRFAVKIDAGVEKPPNKAGLDFRTRGCPACKRLSERMFDFFAKWQYVLASEEKAQAVFARNGGFCPLHMWQLVSVASPQGLSIGLPVLLDRLAYELSEISKRKNSGKITNSFKPAKSCAACQFLTTEEQVVVSQLIDQLQTGPGLTLYRRSQGVCLHHLERVLSDPVGNSLKSELIPLAARRFGEWAEDMQNYALKRDAVRRALLNSDEDDAYIRAVIHLAGARALCVPWQDDGLL